MDQSSNNSIFEKAFNPVLQAGTVLGTIFIVILGAKAFHVLDIMEMDPLFPWLTASSFILFFAMFNSIFSLSAKNLNKYWSRSIMSFMGLAVLAGFLAYLFSNVAIYDARSYQWIFLVLTVGYLIFLSMMGFMKRVVEFAQREEWNQPKKRK